MPAAAKKEFDQEKFFNPFGDTRILANAAKDKPVKKILAGIDIEGAELLLADKLEDIDLVISHHPSGKAYADIHNVVEMQAEVLADYGVPINIAESLIKARISEISRGVSPINHNRTVDMANILKLSFLCVHTPADNLGANLLVKLFRKKKPETVEEILDILKEIPEYSEAVKYNMGPALFVGSPENSCGRIAVTEFTGGTSGSKNIYEKLAQAGIGTIIGMHMKEEYRQEAEKYHINVVIAGHMASDSLGMNLFLDKLEKRGIKIIPCSGMIRIKRK